MSIKVFISYSRKDGDALERVAGLLDRLDGVEYWCDRKLVAGQNWARRLAQELKASDALALLISRSALESDYCQGEALRALDCGKTILPLYLEDCGEASASDFDVRLSLYQSLFIYKMSDDELLDALEKMLRVVGPAASSPGGAKLDVVECFRRSVQARDAEAEFKLGYCYQKGLYGLEADPAQARYWYERAAAHGSMDAMNNLGVIHYNGSGVDKDPAAAAEWYQRAVDAGSALACRNLAVYYRYEDQAEGAGQRMVDSYRLAADRGDVPSMLELGKFCYYGSRGVRKDRGEAMKWYRRAAEAGDPQAMYYLGVNLHNGDGAPCDDATARAWLEKSAQRGNQAAKSRLATWYAGA